MNSEASNWLAELRLKLAGPQLPSTLFTKDTTFNNASITLHYSLSNAINIDGGLSIDPNNSISRISIDSDSVDNAGDALTG